IGLSKVTLSGFGTSTFFNGQTVTVQAGPSATQFLAAFTHANSSATENGNATPVVSVLTGKSSSNSECNSTATVTNVQVAAGIATITAANNFTPGISIQFNVGTATFLNGQTLQVSSATPTSF